MKPFVILACLATSILVSACSFREDRVVQPAPATAAVVAPAPGNVVYTDTPGHDDHGLHDPLAVPHTWRPLPPAPSLHWPIR